MKKYKLLGIVFIIINVFAVNSVVAQVPIKIAIAQVPDLSESKTIIFDVRSQDNYIERHLKGALWVDRKIDRRIDLCNDYLITHPYQAKVIFYSGLDKKVFTDGRIASIAGWFASDVATWVAGAGQNAPVPLPLEEVQWILDKQFDIYFVSEDPFADGGWLDSHNEWVETGIGNINTDTTSIRTPPDIDGSVFIFILAILTIIGGIFGYRWITDKMIRVSTENPIDREQKNLKKRKQLINDISNDITITKTDTSDKKSEFKLRRRK